MSVSLALDPLLPALFVLALAGLAAALGLLALRRRAGLRLVAITVLTLALLNPSLVREEREPLPDVVALVIDDSASMQVGERPAAAEAAAQAIRDAAAADVSLELVEVAAPPGDEGTRLFDAITEALAEAPAGRLAGLVTVTDGRVHDAPDSLGDLERAAPAHAIIVGDRRARDRRLEVLQAPPFGIVGERVRFGLRVLDPGAEEGERAEVTLSLDGAEPITATAPIGEAVSVDVSLSRRGANVVQITVAPAEGGELTLANNTTAVSVSGVRDRLRVLLVTGEPHAGARAWRDLLKSDPSVDLVHFTILRPPEKQDGTPIDELSLIAFPTRQLFEQKLNDFDLVIFDRYKRRGVLEQAYLDNIARYVDRGGALLIAAGPPFADVFSLHRTPLAAVIPARPTSGVVEKGFRPTLTEAGRAHPVTGSFAQGAEQPQWGRWFRVIDAVPISGDILLEAPEGRPLLILDRVGRGRVGLVLSDHAWLWNRGVEGGGPYAELFRRLAHWLMQEPELEEEQLTADIADGTLSVTRATMSEETPSVGVVAPSGAEVTVPVSEVAPGRYAGEIQVNEQGLHRVLSGELNAVAAAGPLNPKEMTDLSPTDEVLRPLLDATGGGSYFLDAAGAARLPDIRRTRADADQSGRAWLGLKRNEAYTSKAVERTPLAPALLAVAIALGLTTLAWAREGR